MKSSITAEAEANAQTPCFVAGFAYRQVLGELETGEMFDPNYACRVALLTSRHRASVGRARIFKAGSNLEIDDEAKQIVQEIGTAINESVENSPRVAEAIERLRDAGYEMELTLRLEIGLRPQAIGDEAQDDQTVLTLTDEDMQVLHRMKIRIDPED